jgi:glycosyltransferase involved in cell wall biosynthesis
MRVLHIINSLIIGGAERLITESLPLFKNKNVETDILLLSSEETVFYKELKKTFKGKIYKSPISNIYNPLQIKVISRYIDNYDLIHVHLFPSMYWASISKKLSKSSRPFIFTEHSTVNKRMSNSILSRIDNKIYLNFDTIIAITPQVKEALVENIGIKEDKIEIIYNGININKYANSPGFSKDKFFSCDGTKLLIQVANFSKAKDQKTTISSLMYLPDNYCLLLVGEGELKKECEEHVYQLGLENRVKFLGSRSDVAQLLKTSDIVIQSSNWEGFGLSAVEGMASGKPVIASNVPGLSEIVNNAGLLFRKHNSKELAEKILKLSDQDFYNYVVELCVKRSLNFDISTMVDKQIELYNKIVR